MNLIELVPRDLTEVTQQARMILDRYDPIDGINIPDVLRLTHRSYDVADSFLSFHSLVVPHIRAIDLPIDRTLEIMDRLVQKGLQSVLIVSGDHPGNEHEVFDVSSVELIQNIKRSFSDLKVFGALDPYRTDFDAEIAYIQKKREAGVDGVFTQPFFSLETAKTYLKALSDMDVFVGVSPVTTQKNLEYWQTKNKVTFPDDFSLDFSFQCQLARDLLALSKSYHQHAYLMPITVDPISYLEELFY